MAQQRKEPASERPEPERPALVATPPPPPFRNSFSNLMEHPGNKQVIRKLVAYTLLMFLCPIMVYFLVTANVGPLLDVPAHRVSIYGAVAAVIMANLVIVAYVVSAFREDDNEHQD
jgi:hypothetical protein